MSRDRKKQHTEFLERRIEELEALLESQGVTAPVAHTPASTMASDTSELEEENRLLKEQLENEKALSASLQSRLSNLETNMVRLEKLFAASITTPSSAATATPLATAALDNVSSTVTDGSQRLVAREVSLQRRLPLPNRVDRLTLSRPSRSLIISPAVRSSTLARLSTSTTLLRTSMTSGAAGLVNPKHPRSRSILLPRTGTARRRSMAAQATCSTALKPRLRLLVRR